MTAFEFFARAPAVDQREATLPTPLLAHLAGAHAPAIAAVWPAPHLEFLGLIAARRHLAAMALARVRADEAHTVRALIERAPLRDVLSFALRPAPRGLPRALSRMGETLWTSEEYEALLALLEEPNANLVLRHTEVIDTALIERLAVLPLLLRTARIVANIQTLDGARTLSEAFVAARLINPKRPERDLVQAWSRAAGPEALLRTAIEAIKPDRFGAMPAAPEMPKPYKRLLTRAALDEVALRFRNCAAGYIWEVAADEMALYLYDGEPEALIALKRDIGGWRLAEALREQNYALADADLIAIVADFQRAGVRAGSPIRALEDRLESLADAVTIVQAAPYTYRTSLGLGQLWR